MAFSQDGRRALRLGADGSIREFDLVTGSPAGPAWPSGVKLDDPGLVSMPRAAYSGDGRHVVTLEQGNTLRVRVATTGEPFGQAVSLPENRPFHHASLNHDGSRLVTIASSDWAQVWEVQTGRRAFPAFPLRAGFRNIMFSRDGSKLLIADDRAYVYSAANGKPLIPPLTSNGRIAFAEFSPDARRIVTASEDGTARVWDASTGKPLTPLLQRVGRITYACFSPNGRKVVTVGDDRVALVWDAETGDPVTPPLMHDGEVHHAKFSPDGKLLATVAGNMKDGGEAVVWDVAPLDSSPRELASLSRVLSNHEITEPVGLTALSADDLLAVWGGLRGRRKFPPPAAPGTHRGARE